MEKFEKIEKLISTDPGQNLKNLALNYPGRVIFSTSFGKEDQAILHLIHSIGADIKVFTLDTGRLFPETYYTWTQSLEKYSIKIETYYPNQFTLEKLISDKGPNLFYESVENRKACCNIRKVEPLQRALKGNEIWITGIRSAQSGNRSLMKNIEYDSNFGIYKFHPLFDWSNEELENYIQKNNIPINPLHAKNYPSIGCQPCTRAIKPGEDERAGRWWWELNDKKECGLHTK